MSSKLTIEPNSAEISFSKAQLLKSARFTPLERDVLSATLEDAAHYPIEEAIMRINQFMKQEVR
ncbi:hypothetical protein [Paenibacillus nasutitermitis]|uniref:Uncharacterized protein n=1 Tax=Paenibacillus nasutitermitis TaxID=1652958 RepID=A0A916ZFV0_9BACL|nr:hypothetical protein [Paenibacillus nasutitermitis]GGD95131.1 hypothetical protein GCM10010911_62290 [Paenibacillus nasutitermitis]